MVKLDKPSFEAAAFLMSAGLGRRIVQLMPKQPFFTQGDPADSVFYLQKGQAKITVVSEAGKEATIAILSAGDFVGEEALVAVPGLRLSTATATLSCPAARYSRYALVKAGSVPSTLRSFSPGCQAAHVSAGALAARGR